MFKKSFFAALVLCLGLTFPAMAEIEKKEAAIDNIEMSWPYVTAASKAATKAINADIRGFMDDFRYDYMAHKFISGRTWFDTAYEDKDLVSFTMYDLRNDGKVNKMKAWGAVYDLKTGQRIPLQNVVKLTVDDLKAKSKTNFFRDGYVKFVPKKPITRVPEDYILGNGGIDIIFQVDELGDLLDGIITAHLSQEEIREINEAHSAK
jgi:hypothetical protein